MTIIEAAQNYAAIKAEVECIHLLERNIKCWHQVTPNTEIKPDKNTSRLLRYYADYAARAEELLRSVEQALDGCGEDAAEVIRLNLFEGETLENIALDKYIGLTTVNRLKRKGLDYMKQSRGSIKL